MAACGACPVDPHRLRRDRGHPQIAIQLHERDTLVERLEPDVPAGRRRPVLAGVVLLVLPRRRSPNPIDALEGRSGYVSGISAVIHATEDVLELRVRRDHLGGWLPVLQRHPLSAPDEVFSWRVPDAARARPPRGVHARTRPGASCNRYIRSMELAARSDESLHALALQVRQEQLRRRGRTHTCNVCGKQFVARAGARTCSTTCRVRAQRARARSSRKDME